MSKKKTLIIIISILVIVISIIMSIYLPNRKKIEEKIEVTSTYYKMKEEDKYGIINEKGELILEPKYEEIIIPNANKAVFICKNEDEQKILNDKNEEILTQYENIEPIQLINIITESAYETNVLKYQKDGKYGLINLEGEKIADPKYDEISSLGYKDGEVLIKENNKYGILNTITGTTIIKTIYDSIESDQYYNETNGYKRSGYIVCNVTSDGYRYGYYDYEGEMVLEAEYNQITRLTQVGDKTDIYLIIAKNGQYGVYINNNKVINTEYQSISYNSGLEMFVVEKTGQFGAINEKGVQILNIEYSDIQINGIYMYTKKGEEQIIYDIEGKKINIPSNVIIEKTDNPDYYIKIEQNEETTYTLVNSRYEDVIEQKYTYIENLYNGYFIAINDSGKTGIIDIEGNVIVDFVYDLIQTVKNKDVIQAFDFENNITDIYNKDMKKTIEINNAKIESNKEYIKVYNEEEEIYLDNNGDKIVKKEILEEIKNSDATVQIGEYKKVIEEIGSYYYTKIK